MNVNRIYRESSLARMLEPVTMPSMCENMHIPTIGDIFNDYCRGIVRPELMRTSFGDEGDELVETRVAEDLTDLAPENPLAFVSRAKRPDRVKGSPDEESGEPIYKEGDGEGAQDEQSEQSERGEE